MPVCEGVCLGHSETCIFVELACVLPILYCRALSISISPLSHDWILGHQAVTCHNAFLHAAVILVDIPRSYAICTIRCLLLVIYLPIIAIFDIITIILNSAQNASRNEDLKCGSRNIEGHSSHRTSCTGCPVFHTGQPRHDVRKKWKS